VDARDKRGHDESSSIARVSSQILESIFKQPQLRDLAAPFARVLL
jgi:hypothetical protein